MQIPGNEACLRHETGNVDKLRIGDNILSIVLAVFHESKEVRRMKKAMSEKALAQEAALWNRLKKATKENPGKVCHK